MWASLAICFLQIFRLKFCMHAISLPCLLYIPTKEKMNYEFLIMRFSASSCSFMYLSSSQYSPQHAVLKYPPYIFFPKVLLKRRQVSCCLCRTLWHYCMLVGPMITDGLTERNGNLINILTTFFETSCKVAYLPA